jgi:hypothetical protein
MLQTDAEIKEMAEKVERNPAGVQPAFRTRARSN